MLAMMATPYHARIVTAADQQDRIAMASLLQRQVMADLKKNIHRQMTIPDHVDDPDLGVYVHRPSGRWFSVSWLAEDLFHAVELLPIDSQLREAIQANPNDTLRILARDGFATEDVCRGAADTKHADVFVESIEAMTDAITRAIDGNRILDSEAGGLEIGPDLPALSAAQDALLAARENAAYFEQIVQDYQQGFGVLAGAHGVSGQLSAVASSRILSYLNAPSEATWRACHNIMVGQHTLWGVWRLFDGAAPETQPLDAPWPSLPDPTLLRGWLIQTLKREREEAVVQLQEAQELLRQAENDYANAADQADQQLPGPSR